MALTPMHCHPYLGTEVIVHSHYGIHHGVLREVRMDGIVLANARVLHIHASGDSGEKNQVQHADQPDDLRMQTAFFPFLFLPFAALAAIGAASAATAPYGYGYGYGYPRPYPYYW